MYVPWGIIRILNGSLIFAEDISETLIQVPILSHAHYLTSDFLVQQKISPGDGQPQQGFGKKQQSPWFTRSFMTSVRRKHFSDAAIRTMGPGHT